MTNKIAQTTWISVGVLAAIILGAFILVRGGL